MFTKAHGAFLCDVPQTQYYNYCNFPIEVSENSVKIDPVNWYIVQPLFSPQSILVGLPTYTSIAPIITPPISTPSINCSIIPSREVSPVSCYESDASSANDLQRLYVSKPDTIQYYLSLPKDLFPSARKLAIDPNQMIDEFCKQTCVQAHLPWLLDLEFGIPKSPITRMIPIYNVKLNSINCKNEPDAIHPGFESLSDDLKKALLFYFECIVSLWYRGYVIMKSDESVDNFQTWLSIPMQLLGMCWS